MVKIGTHRVFPNPERASDRQAANPMGARRPADQAARALSSCRRGTGANVAGEASWDVRWRRREGDTRRSECDGLDEHSGRQNGPDAPVPKAAPREIVIGRFRSLVGRRLGTEVAAIPLPDTARARRRRRRNHRRRLQTRACPAGAGSAWRSAAAMRSPQTPLRSGPGGTPARRSRGPDFACSKRPQRGLPANRPPDDLHFTGSMRCS